MRILITGSCGYIGSSYVQNYIGITDSLVQFDNFRYDQGVLFAGSYDEPFALYIEDVTKWSHNLKQQIKKADVIIPLAALVGAPLCDKFPKEAVELNQNWMVKLTKLLSKDQLCIFPNTNSGYGSVTDGICTEETPSNPISLYGRTKQQAEEILLNEHTNSIVFRLATVFGASLRPRLDLLVNNMTLEAYQTGNINVFDGHFRRNYVHVMDVCDAFNFAIVNQDKMRQNVYNLGNDEINMTKLKLAETIAKLTDAKITEISGPVDNDKRDYVVSSEKLRKIGFAATTSLEHGVQELLEYFPFLPKSDLPFLRNY